MTYGFKFLNLFQNSKKTWLTRLKKHVYYLFFPDHCKVKTIVDTGHYKKKKTFYSQTSVLQ